VGEPVQQERAAAKKSPPKRGSFRTTHHSYLATDRVVPVVDLRAGVAKLFSGFDGPLTNVVADDALPRLNML